MGCRKLQPNDFRFVGDDKPGISFSRGNRDYMGRRVEKKVYSGSAGNWTLEKHERFVYDNYLQIEKLDALNSNAIRNKRVWSDGKILCDIHSTPAGATRYYALGDANKNITDYVDASGTVQAHYEYSPFGKITASSGAMEDDFDYRFSSEVFDGETGLVYYNYRYYSAELGRWLSRDPIGKKGGFNLYAMVEDDPVGRWDDSGLDYPDNISAGTGLGAPNAMDKHENDIASLVDEAYEALVGKKAESTGKVGDVTCKSEAYTAADPWFQTWYSGNATASTCKASFTHTATTKTSTGGLCNSNRGQRNTLSKGSDPFKKL